MIQVALETHDHQPVVSGMIPSFNELPDVVHWGIRIFQLRLSPSEKDESDGEDPVATYTEVFAVALVSVLEAA